MASIAGFFDSYYDLLGLALVILVPIWFARFAIEAVALIVGRWRDRRLSGS